MCLFLKVSDTWWSNLSLGQDSHPAHWSPKSSTEVVGTCISMDFLPFSTYLSYVGIEGTNKLWPSRPINLMSLVGQRDNLWHDEIRYLKALALFGINPWDKTEFVLLSLLSVIKLLLGVFSYNGQNKTSFLRLISAYHSPEVETKSSVRKSQSDQPLTAFMTIYILQNASLSCPYQARWLNKDVIRITKLQL